MNRNAIYNRLLPEVYFNPKAINNILNLLGEEIEVEKCRKKEKYIDLPCAFDIETSSFYVDGEKKACMYLWSFNLAGYTLIGRTWEEFLIVLKSIQSYMELSIERRLLVFCHNLNFEFQWIRKWFEWEKVFSVDMRKPVYAITKDGIEFRCSYLLSGYSLAKVGEHLLKYKMKKLSGDLDFSLIRHSKTELSQKEINYSAHDVKVLICYIMETSSNDGALWKIPLTKTGYVRRFIREKCFVNPSDPKKSGWKRARYMKYIHSLNLEPDEFLQLRRAFQGGFTHSNPYRTKRTLKNVDSIDFTSSYPYVMLSELYPQSSSEVVEIHTEEEFHYYMQNYCCVFDIEFINLRSVFKYDSYISYSKAIMERGALVQNGRIVSADYLATTITNIDFSIIERCYAWEEISVYNFRIYKATLLPKEYFVAILQLYKEKTTLKNVVGMEQEYLRSKENINSLFGMSVFNPVREEYTYVDEWGKEPPDLEEALTKYNEGKNRVDFYPVGVFITSYARKNLWEGIFEFKDDYIYADTDSIKCINIEKHQRYIDTYNETCKKKLTFALSQYNLSYENCEPKTIKGVKKPLGVWDIETAEGKYHRFRTLGAKRYIYEDHEGLHITVSGLNKKKTAQYLSANYKDPFTAFDDGLVIPGDHTGKGTHTYIDEEIFGEVTDYTGKKGYFRELSAIHIEEASYNLTLSDDYMDFLTSIIGEQSYEVL